MRQPRTGRGSSDPHGRGAQKPSEIPATGWKEALWRVYSEIGDDRVTLVAAGVTYYLLLALVPGLTAMISIYGLFADPAAVTGHLDMLRGIVPQGGMQILEEQLTRLASQGGTTLGLTFVISLAIALWSANAGMKSLFEAMNVAYDERESRSFIKLNAVSLSFTLCTILGALLLVGLVVVLPAVLAIFNLGTATSWLIGIVGLLVTLLVLSLGIAALYRWGPDRQNAKWRWITPGAILTLVVTAIASVLFSWYTANFGSYNATYGSLGALIGFMTWIWLTMIILIVGGELNSELEHQTAQDSTTGTPQPRGSRGAKMADTVAGGDDKAAGGGRRSGRRRNHPSSRDDGAERPRERLSLGRLAVAVPAALVFLWATKRSERSGGSRTGSEPPIAGPQR